ncbi:hypothetical protein BZG01_16505 [Labilibaculum manganireducens]|uniref:HTH tetR-type domain-containing protein n=1 Tax=Labilibaculum manganireducens TaxID=1940525 RepID=A0A2N3HY55_9BACT|nr:TetR/AcrR family transcriptional regulator [Labilibaculum manganireducens]PKQ62984.1 hypothetical protein BZG01_16505 [Labilibaculum manganireducens]
MILDKDEIAKNEIISEAQKLFQQYGLKKTTMDEIASACGKAKSTLYYYFKSKEDVFDAVINLELITLRQIVKNKVSLQKSMLDKISTYIVEFHKEVIRRANLYRIIKQNYFAEIAAKKYFSKMIEFEKSYIIRIIEDGYDLGEYNMVERSDIEWVAEMTLVSFYGLVEYSIEKDGFLDEEKMLKAVKILAPRIFC